MLKAGEQNGLFSDRVRPIMDITGSTPLPVNLPQLEGLDLKARYHSDRCDGDFFDGVAIGSRVVFLLMDIAGRRAETHPIAVEVQNVFRTRAQDLFELPEANESDAIAQLALDVNRSLIEAADGVRFAPAFLGCFNLTLGILTYHNAGRIFAVFHDANSVRVLEPGGIPLGLFTHSTYEPAVLAFEPRSKLLLVTKGITERRRGAAVFGGERVRRLLQNSSADSASRICEAVLREAFDFGNHPWSRVYDFLHLRKPCRRDDLTAVALVRPAGSELSAIRTAGYERDTLA
jgi:serine phosphatase RsbU (regulator of sigma subunit)